MEGGCWGFQVSLAALALQALSLLLLFSRPLRTRGCSAPRVSPLPSREGWAGLKPPAPSRNSNGSVPEGQRATLVWAPARSLHRGEAQKSFWKKLILCNSSTRGSDLRCGRICSVPPSLPCAAFLPLLLLFNPHLSWIQLFILIFRDQFKTLPQPRKLPRFAFNIFKYLTYLRLN